MKEKVLKKQHTTENFILHHTLLSRVATSLVVRKFDPSPLTLPRIFNNRFVYGLKLSYPSVLRSGKSAKTILKV